MLASALFIAAKRWKKTQMPINGLIDPHNMGDPHCTVIKGNAVVIHVIV
jgi:hypothetical protein